MGFLHTIFNHQSHQRESKQHRRREKNKVHNEIPIWEARKRWCAMYMDENLWRFEWNLNFVISIAVSVHGQSGIIIGVESTQDVWLVVQIVSFFSRNSLSFCNLFVFDLFYNLVFLFNFRVSADFLTVPVPRVTSMDFVHRWNNHLSHWIGMKLDINGINLLIVLILNGLLYW